MARRSRTASFLGPLSLLAVLTGCPPSEVLDRSTGPLTGYEPLVVDLDGTGLAPADIEEVWLGGVPAFRLEPVDGALRFIPQGAEQPGPADLELVTADGSLTLTDAFTFLPPADPLFDRVVAIGASLTQGVQNAVPTQRSLLASPALRVARQMGAWLPGAMLAPDLFQDLTVADVAPPPDCSTPAVLGFIASSTGEVMGDLRDPETDEFAFWPGRTHPDLPLRNLAVGGSRIGDQLEGPDPSDFGTLFLSKLILEPYGSFADPLAESAMERAEAIQPTLIFSTDLYGNDVINAVSGDDFRPDLMTTVEDFEARLLPLLDRLEATGAEVFLADLPRPSLLPRADRFEDAQVAQMDERAARFDAILAAELAGRPRIHLVPVHERVEEVVLQGLALPDGSVAGIGAYGGLLSLDGLHFSDTGYAMLADIFLETVESELGIAVEPIDIPAIAAEDPNSQAQLLAAGLDPACLPD